MSEDKIGVFDSGVGGLAIALAIRRNLPSYEVVYKDDSEHVPYGTKSIEEIYNFTKPVLDKLVDDGCKVIVIACNTVTTNLIDRLRAELSVPLIGMEPALKPAAQSTKTGVIAVCATPRTLASKRYQWLKGRYAAGVKVLEPDCSDWAYMIENNHLNRRKIMDTTDDICRKKADRIVLGCTHYHWIEELIKDGTGGRAEVIKPEDQLVKNLKEFLQREVVLGREG